MRSLPLAGLFVALLAAGSAQPLVKTESPRPALLSGTVTDLGGAAVAGAMVRLVPEPGAGAPTPAPEAPLSVPRQSAKSSPTPNERTFAVTTGAEGAFSLAVPKRGRYRLEVTREGLAGVRVPEIVLEPGSTRTIPVRLQPGGIVRGRVRTPQGKAVPGAEVAVDLGHQRPPSLRPGSEKEGDLVAGRAKAKTDAEGRYQLGVLPAATGYLLEVRHQEFPPAVKVFDVPRSRKEIECEVVLPPGGEVRGRVRDAAKKPVAGVEARAIDLQRPVQAGADEPRATSQADGLFRLRPLPAGIYRVEVRPPGGLLQTYDGLELQDGQVINLGILRLEPGLSVSGTVADGRGEPVKQVVVKAMRSVAYSLTLERSARTDDAGFFRLTGLREARYDLIVDAGGDFLEARKKAVEAPASGVLIELSRGGVVEGEVHARDGGVLEDLEVWAVESDDPPKRCAGRVTDPELGLFRIERLPKGELEVRARARGYGIASTPLTIEGSETAVPVTLELERGQTISGQVVEAASGSGVAGATVAHEDGQGGAVTTGADGRFALAGTQQGRLVLTALHPDFAPARVPVALADGPPEPVTIPLSRGATVEGKVTSAGGRPLAGVPIEARLEWRPIASAWTGEDGAYRIEHLVPGDLTVVRRGGGGGRDDFEERPVVLRDEETARVDFRLGGVVRGVVSRAGLPMGGVRISLNDVFNVRKGNDMGDFGLDARGGFTDPQGEFRLTGVAPGEKALNVEHEQQRTIRLVNIPDQQESVLDVSLPRRLVTGIVVDGGTGKGVHGANIEAHTRSATRSSAKDFGMVGRIPGEGGEEVQFDATFGDGEKTYAGPDGTFRIWVESGASTSIHAGAWQYGDAVAEIGKEGPQKPLRMELFRRAILKGRILDWLGNPIPQARLCEIEGEGIGCNGAGQGGYEIERFPDRGPWILAAVAEGLAPHFEPGPEIPPDAPEDTLVHDLKLVAGGGLLVRLRSSANLELKGIVGAGGGDLLRALRYLDLIESPGEGQPFYRIPALEPGAYTLLFGPREGEEESRRTIEIRPGQTAEISLD